MSAAIKNQKSQDEKKIKCVVVGDSRVGKKELINAIVTANPNNTSVVNTISDKTMFECKETNVILNNETYTCSLFCPNGQEEYDRLRPLLYQETDVFIIAFSVDDVVSLENAKNKWYPEVQNYTPNVPFILVGTKSDLRTSKFACIYCHELT